MGRGTRIALVSLGAVVALVGWFLWTVETEYSSLSFTTTEVNGEIQVWEHPESWDQTDIRVDHPESKTPEALAAAGGDLVFTGTPSQAEAYMADRHEDSNNYLVEGLVIAAGVAIIVTGLMSKRQSSIEKEMAALAG